MDVKKKDNFDSYFVIMICYDDFFFIFLEIGVNNILKYFINSVFVLVNFLLNWKLYCIFYFYIFFVYLVVFILFSFVY